MEKSNKMKKFFSSKTFALLILLAVIIVFFEFASPNFSYLKTGNIRIILNAMVMYMLFAVAQGFLIISGEIDLSSGYTGAFSGIMLAALLQNTGIPWFLIVLLCLLVGVVFGLFNAVLINEFGFQSFIATLATGSFIARGFGYIIVGGKSIEIKDPVIVWLGTGRIGGVIPVAVIFSLLAIIIYGFILSKTKFGRSVYLCGGNRTAARLAGLNPKKISYILFANSGAIGALAGIFYVARLKVGNLTGTANYVFPAITAVILGGVSFGGGSGGMLGCFIGLTIINCFNNGLTVLGVSPNWQSVASCLLLLLALTLDYFSNRNMKFIRAPRKSKVVRKWQGG